MRGRGRRKKGQNFYYVFCLSWSETCRKEKKLAGIKKIRKIFKFFYKSCFYLKHVQNNFEQKIFFLIIAPPPEKYESFGNIFVAHFLSENIHFVKIS